MYENGKEKDFDCDKYGTQFTEDIIPMSCFTFLLRFSPLQYCFGRLLLIF